MNKWRYYAQRLLFGKPNLRPLWDEDADFINLMRQIREHTVVDKRRCYVLYQFVRTVGGIAGDIAEVGVYKGGTAKLLAKCGEPYGKTVHLFDTFSGMPQPDPKKDLHRAGDFGNASFDHVKLFLNECKNVNFHPGFFPLTAKEMEERIFSLVHVDVDIYQSVKDSCQFFYPRLQIGGVMIFDDYGFLSCPGAKMAVDEFFSGKPDHPIYLPTGQCILIHARI